MTVAFFFLANCRSRRCCNASFSHPRMYVRIARTFLARPRTRSPCLRQRHVRGLYTWATSPQLSGWLRFFRKETPLSPRQISTWFTTIPRQRTFFILHPVISLQLSNMLHTCNYCFLFGTFATKCSYFSSASFSRRNKLLHC